MDPRERERLVELVGAHTVPYWETLGVTVEEVHAPGHVTLRMPMRREISNRRGVIHGGAIMSLIDAAGGGAARTMTQEGEATPGLPTTDLNVTFVNAARGSVRATGHVVRRGRSLVFVQVEVHDEDEQLVALSRVTYIVTPAS